MKNIEFYTFEDQIWYRTEDGNQHHLTESDRDAIRFIIEKFREFYPEALEASLNEYKRCQANLPHYQYRVVLRLCKCNFGVIDTNISDVDASGCFHFEHVPCPLRGECKYENVFAILASIVKYLMPKCECWNFCPEVFQDRKLQKSCAYPRTPSITIFGTRVSALASTRNRNSLHTPTNTIYSRRSNNGEEKVRRKVEHYADYRSHSGYGLLKQETRRGE